MATLALAKEGPIVRALDAVYEQRMTNLAVPIVNMLNPDLCPANLLPWLAYHYGVDVWSTEWNEATKRAVVREAVTNFKRRGTRDGLIRAIGLLVSDVTIAEWFEEDPQGTPGTFRVDVVGSSTATSAQAQGALSQMISRAAPHTRHWTLNVETILETRAIYGSRATGATLVTLTGTVA